MPNKDPRIFVPLNSVESYDWPWVDAQVSQVVEMWHRSATQSPRCVRRYNATEQSEREEAYDEALQAVEENLQRTSPNQPERIGAQEQVAASFASFSAKALDLDGESIELLTREFLPVGTELAQWARRFDPGLRVWEIIQAARNAWTACGLQPLLGVPVGLTPSILAYSLLYPYSDNYLDDEELSAEEKLQFSQRFRCRLLGPTSPITDERERAISALIALIEGQYPRKDFPQVFESLLAIHQAQEQSIAQLHGGDSEPLRLSCAKGGTSVLADACLARGSLTRQESQFAFLWGVLLQLGDDLQDVRDDMRRRSVTVFSKTAANGRLLDGLTRQLLNFSEEVAQHMDDLPHGAASLKELLRMSWRSLIIRAVAESHEFFSPGFLEEAESCSPFRFDFLRARSDRLASREGLYTALFEALLESRPKCVPTN